MLDVFEHVQKSLMVFQTCWITFVMFERFPLTFDMLYNILIDFLTFLMGFSNVLMDFSNFANMRCRFYCLVLAIRLMCCCQHKLSNMLYKMLHNMFERFAPGFIVHNSNANKLIIFNLF